MDDLIPFLRARLDEDEKAANAWLPFGNPDAADREHIARHDPKRVLAEVAAKRAIIDELARVARAAGGSTTSQRFVIAQLALPYADHPDYCEEWRP